MENDIKREKTGSPRLVAKTLDAAKRNVDQIIPYFVLAILVILIAILQPSALSGSWLANKIDGTMVLIFASMGQSLVMLMYGTDLSIAGIICLTNSLSALIMPNTFLGITGTVLLMCLIGVLAGALNGFIVVKCRLQAFIVTLATWSIFGGFALWILPVDGGKPAEGYVNFVMQRFGGIPLTVIFIVLLILMWAWLRRTRFGISLFAIGRNATSAYNSGINVNWVKIRVYALSGLFAALAGTYRTAYVNSGSPTAGDGYVLLTCCASVLGGINVSGGRGSLYGTIVGAFVLQLLADLLVFAGLSSYWTSLIQGALLITVVAINSVILIVRKKRSLEVG